MKNPIPPAPARRGSTFTPASRRGLAIVMSAGLAVSACGGEEGDFGQTTSAATTSACNDRGVLWGIAGDLVGLVPGLGTLGKVAASATKISQRLACGGAVAATVTDIHSTIDNNNRTQFENAVKPIMQDTRSPSTLTYSDLGDRIDRIHAVEAQGTTVGWASLHTKAQLAALKYGLLLMKLEKTQGKNARAAALAEVERELRDSVTELDRVEQDYLSWASSSVTTGMTRLNGRPAPAHNQYVGWARLDNIRDSAAPTHCKPLVICTKHRKEAQKRGRDLIPVVQRKHRDRVFNADYQKLRARLDAALQHFEYQNPRNECRIKNFGRNTYLKYAVGAPVAGPAISDPKQAGYYDTTWVVEESNTTGSVTLRSGAYYNDLASQSRMLAVGATGNTPRFDTFVESAEPGKWTIERVTSSAPANATELYRIRPYARPQEALHMNSGSVEVSNAAPGWWHSFWVFEGACGRILKSDGMVADEDLELGAMSTSSGFATRIRNVGSKNLKLGVEVRSGVDTLVLKDMAANPGIDVFRFFPVNANDRTYDNMRLEFTPPSASPRYIQPGSGSQLVVSTSMHAVGSTYALKRLTGNTFTIVNQLTRQFVKAGNGRVEMSSTLDDAAKWILEDVDAGYGKVGLEMPANGKCLDLSAGNTSNGAQLQLWHCIDNGMYVSNQEFELVRQGRDRYQIVHSASRKCLDVDAGGTANGTRLQLWACQDGNMNQQFEVRFKPNPFARPSFQVFSLRNSKCVDLSGGATHNGNRFQFWDCATASAGDAHPRQLFTLRFR